jgi:S-formylglutathione hydrolase FrmB
VHRAVLAGVRAAHDRGGWALLGHSTGDYCALNLALRHPDLLAAAAVAPSGYGYPARDRSTGNRFGGTVAVQNANTPVWTAAHPRGLSRLWLVVTSRQDGGSYRDAVQWTAVARPVQVTTVVLPRGGHHAAVWKALQPAAFNRLWGRLTTRWRRSRCRPQVRPRTTGVGAGAVTPSP